jgi:hypothetical protein
VILGAVVCGTTDELAKAAGKLRTACWSSFFANPGFPDDGHNVHAMHFLVLNTVVVIACARLCAHAYLRDAPDAHLYPSLDNSEFAGPFGCFNGLVVDERFRGRGFSAILDRIRTDAAMLLGCRTLLVARVIRTEGDEPPPSLPCSDRGSEVPVIFNDGDD